MPIERQEPQVCQVTMSASRSTLLCRGQTLPESQKDLSFAQKKLRKL